MAMIKQYQKKISQKNCISKVRNSKNGIPSSTNITFQEVAFMWLENYKNTVKESSYSRTEIIFRKHILPSFGKIEISKISTAYCQKIVNTWHSKGSSKQYPLL